jgi:hypothetical protein
MNGYNIESGSDVRFPDPRAYCPSDTTILPLRDIVGASPVRTCKWSNGPETTFGVLEDWGVLSHDLEWAGWGDVDMGCNTIWTLLVDATINGVDYKKGDEIRWEK